MAEREQDPSAHPAASAGIGRSFGGIADLSPTHRWAILAIGMVVVCLVMYCAVVAGNRSDLPDAVPQVTPTPTASRPALKPGPAYDVVSGQPVDPATTPFRTAFMGTELYFASQRTLDEFRRNPLDYVKVKATVRIRLEKDSGAAHRGGPRRSTGR